MPTLVPDAQSTSQNNPYVLRRVKRLVKYLDNEKHTANATSKLCNLLRIVLNSGRICH
jgi:hypothetical protein